LGDIQNGKFPGCNPIDGIAVSYVRAPGKLSSHKYVLTAPVASFCQISFKYGWAVVKIPSDKRLYEQLTTYLDRTLHEGTRLSRCQTTISSPIFELHPRVTEKKTKLECKLNHLLYKLDLLYSRTLPIQVFGDVLASPNVVE
jgi:hypothetical protein